MLAVTLMPPAVGVRRSTSAMRSPATPPDSASVSSMRMMNSSPPQRAVKSVDRVVAESRAATWRSTTSPPACPSRSLTDLNRSMSSIATAHGRPERAEAARTRSIATTVLARLARPVRLSVPLMWRRRFRSRDSRASSATTPTAKAAAAAVIAQALWVRPATGACSSAAGTAAISFHRVPSTGATTTRWS